MGVSMIRGKLKRGLALTQQESWDLLEYIKTLEPRLSEDCNFCSEHEQGDTLYEMSSWDGGIGYDYVRPIKYCPMCGRKLKEEEE